MSWAPGRNGQRGLYPRFASLIIILLPLFMLTFGCGEAHPLLRLHHSIAPTFQPRAFLGDFFMRLPTAAGDGPMPSEAYDPALKEIFISGPNFNSVEACSTVNGKFVGEISIPAPAGLCFSPNFSQLFVGTITPYVYVVDPVALRVTRQIQVSASQLSTNPQGTTMMPVMPFAMADGSLVLGMGYNSQSGSYAGTGVVHLVRYQPSGNAFTSIDPSGWHISKSSPIPEWRVPARFRLRELGARTCGLLGDNTKLLADIGPVAKHRCIPCSERGRLAIRFCSGSRSSGTGSFNSQVNFWGPNLQPLTQYTINGTLFKVFEPLYFVD